MGKKNCCNFKCGMIAMGIVGTVILIIGAIAVPVFNDLFEKILIQEGVIAEGTIMYDAWSVVTTPTYLTFFFYNVTNAKEFMSQTIQSGYVKPVLQEIGPYVFREYLVKDNITFLDTEPEEVFFRQKTTIVYEPEMSVGRLSDMITTLNIIAASIPSIIEYQASLRGIAPEVLIPLYRQLNNLYNQNDTRLLFTHSVNDLLFGFEDDLFTEVIKIVESFLGVTGLPKTFGLFATTNTSAGWYNYQVYTGKDDPGRINIITQYRGMPELDYWDSPTCNMINGTDGSTTPPFMNKEDKVYFFVDDVCRSLYGTFVQSVEVKNIPAWEYTIPPEVFQSPINNPENDCYCPDRDNPFCSVDGAISIDVCMAGAPVMISSPHFLNGDGFYLSQTEGVSEPTQEEHGVLLVYEPNTGNAIKVDKRLQINFALKRNQFIDVLNKIEEQVAFPVLWLNESAEVGDDDADLLYGLIVVPADVVFILQIVLCIVGGIMMVIPITFVLFWYLAKDKGDSSEFELQSSVHPSGNEICKKDKSSLNVCENAALDMKHETPAKF